MLKQSRRSRLIFIGPMRYFAYKPIDYYVFLSFILYPLPNVDVAINFCSSGIPVMNQASESEIVIRRLYQITNDYRNGFDIQIVQLLIMGLEPG